MFTGDILSNFCRCGKITYDKKIKIRFQFLMISDNVEFVVVAILKMATGRNISMSGITSGHQNLPTYEMSLELDNVEFVQY